MISKSTNLENRDKKTHSDQGKKLPYILIYKLYREWTEVFFLPYRPLFMLIDGVDGLFYNLDSPNHRPSHNRAEKLSFGCFCGCWERTQEPASQANAPSTASRARRESCLIRLNLICLPGILGHRRRHGPRSFPVDEEDVGRHLADQQVRDVDQLQREDADDVALDQVLLQIKNNS